MALFNYIAILGRQPELGLVELESLLGSGALEPFGRYAVLYQGELDIDRLGGSVKLGRVLYDGPVADIRSMPVDIAVLPMRASKTSFAISVYGIKATPRFVTVAGLELKKRLTPRGSVRFVAPVEGLAVTAAQLMHNRVLEQGFELLVVVSGQRMVVAQTTGVQDIEWYSRRDYGRPVRSAKVGMLPPKLAQILVNTTSSPVVIDPFCGTGVVLAEALLLGRAAYGFDLAEEMVAASQQNLAWLTQEVARPLANWAVAVADARAVALPAAGAVVSEGYLGPNQTHSPAPQELVAMRHELLGLYREVLANFARQLPSGGEVSIAVPAWRANGAWHHLGLVDELPNLGYTLKGFKHARTPLLYARGDQVVGRQLLLLRKN